jgi:hypothetical protein
MTTRKGFKRLVRARMSKTGESYAAARRSLLGDTASTVHDGAARGLHPDTSAVATALARTGIVSPVTGRPLSEALVLVAGGGLGAGYILWEFKGADAAIVTLGFRNRWQYPAAWMVTAIERLGIAHTVHETGVPARRAPRWTRSWIVDSPRSLRSKRGPWAPGVCPSNCSVTEATQWWSPRGATRAISWTIEVPNHSAWMTRPSPRLGRGSARSSTG